MPVYIYHNTETDEYREIFQGMNDVHEYYGKDGDETSWKRVFTVPQARIDGELDPFSSKQFVDKTANKKGTYGDLLDRSAEMSAKRAALNGGVDPVKQNYYDKYSKERNGAKHPDQMKKNYDSKNVSIDWGSN